MLSRVMIIDCAKPRYSWWSAESPQSFRRGRFSGYHPPVLYIVTDSRASYPRILKELQDSGGAEVLEMAPDDESDRGGVPPSKARIVRHLISPALLGLRERWGSRDSVLVIGWYVLPILVLIRVGMLRRPRKLVAMGVFVQSPWIRRAVNALLRATRIPELEVMAFSEGERRVLIDAVGIAPERVHKLIWGGFPEAAHEVVRGGPPYIFSGGYANRDYPTLFAAVEGLEYPVVVAASSLNRLRDSPANVDLRTDIPEEDFEQLVIGCHLLVVPLLSTGEASGQSVLFRGIQHRCPIVGTRHDGLADYLGEGYPGFVPAGDPAALRTAITRAVSDESFRSELLEAVTVRRDILNRERDSARAVLAILQS
jgi:glycosyltransferase involved in cell wall biosynthesis